MSSKFTSPLEKAAQWVSRMPRHTMAWTGLALAGVVFLAINLISATLLRSVKADFTKEGLYTISEGTRKALQTIDEPIDIRVYYSNKLGEAAPSFAKNFERVRTLLEQYRSISGNKLQISYIDPEPFSDAEDRAVAAGLRGIRLNPEGDLGYFGIVGANSTDNEETIGFFSPERERFIEYDVTKLIYSLAHPKKPVIGLVSTLPVDGGLDPVMGMRQPLPQQMVMQQIRDVFEVRTLGKDFKEVPAEVDVLMIVQPDALPAETVYAIDQFALKGGRVLAFVDPVAETLQPPNPMMFGATPNFDEFGKLLKAWGVNFDGKQVAGDIEHARRVQFGGGFNNIVTDYVAWLSLDSGNLDQSDVLSAGIERLNLASVGFLSPAEGATTKFAPVIQTSAEAMVIPTEKISPMPDAVGLLREYKPGGKPLVIAARVSGQAKSAYPDGRPKAEKSDHKDDSSSKSESSDASKADAEKEKAEHRAEGNINVLIIADTDLLSDQFWVDVREFLGQQIAVPHAHNSALVVNALENLSGSDALITLRGRGVVDRPFELVAEIRRDAERRYREKEQALTNKLKELQDQLARLEKVGEGETVILTDKEREAIERFRGEMLTVRRELREVKRALREDIDRLDAWLKFANIGAVPLLLGAGAVGWALVRRRRKN
ncbi:MAG: Gldg family protein [Hyphomicrobiaceae bacterium]